MAKSKSATAAAPVATRVRTDTETFVTAYIKHGGNAKAIAAELGISPNSVTVRASQYRNRKEGPINLPRAVRVGGGNRVDADATNKLIESLLTKVPEEKVAE